VVVLVIGALMTAMLALPAQAAPTSTTNDTPATVPGSATTTTTTEPVMPTREFTTKELGPPPAKGNTTDFVVDRKWYGLQVKFSRLETEFIAYGGGSCAAMMSQVPGAGWILAVNCAALSSAAAWARSRGNCLAVNVYFAPGMVNPWYWNC
jgi:hypothetical protein